MIGWLVAILVVRAELEDWQRIPDVEYRDGVIWALGCPWRSRDV